MDSDIFQGMEGIRIQYLQNILSESSSIRLSIENHQAQEKSIRVFAHQIYGSGTSYGFDFISDAGKAVSESLNQNHDPKQLIPILTSLENQLNQALEKLSS